MTDHSPDRKTRNLDEAAKMLGVSRTTMENAAKSGQIPTIRVGRRWLVPTAVLDKLVAGEQ